MSADQVGAWIVTYLIAGAMVGFMMSTWLALRFDDSEKNDWAVGVACGLLWPLALCFFALWTIRVTARRLHAVWRKP